MGDVNLEIKLNNIDERVIKIEESGGGSGGDGYITSVSNDFNVVNKKLSLSNDVTTKLSKVDTPDNLSVELAKKIDKPTSATEGQVLTYRNNEWVADDSQGGGGQFVIIAKGKAYEGQTVTATKGTKSKSAVITSGVARIPVDEGGVWTLTLSSGETWNTPNMTYYGEYEVALVPNGSTVTPTDDIQIWLKCADLNKSYTNISQVLADTNTFSALISDNNAVDYMVRSTTWASDVCNNESAMTYIGLNDYCSNKLLADSTWCTAICNSAYFEKVLNVKVPTMTSNTGSDGGEAFASGNNSGSFAYFAFDGDNDTIWISDNSKDSYVGYKFPEAVCIKKFTLYEAPSRFKNLKLEATNNINDWSNPPLFSVVNTDKSTTLKAHTFNVNNSSNYQYYRIYVTDQYTSYKCNAHELQFYGRKKV